MGGDQNEQKLHGVFCGATFPAPVTSEGNILRIEFNSDNSVQKTGFVAEFRTGKLDCFLLLLFFYQKFRNKEMCRQAGRKTDRQTDRQTHNMCDIADYFLLPHELQDMVHYF